VADPS
jgi:hypothetical protein